MGKWKCGIIAGATLAGVLWAGAGLAADKRSDNFPDYFWLAFAPHHALDVVQWEKEYHETYLCPAVTAARAVVKAVPDSNKVSSARKETAFTSAAKAQHCMLVKVGEFRPTHLYEERTIADEGTGEPLEIWAAIAATDARASPSG